MRFYIIILLVLNHLFLEAQTVEIPTILRIADMELTLSVELKKIVSSQVNGMVNSPKYFNAKVDKANIHFPIIERIFKESNIPDDFKYLIIQESAIRPDVVSVSNAVGYWQFKKETAIELGLRVDHLIDERKSIVASSIGAAKYFNRSNEVLNNWIHTLLSYNLGLGGVKRSVDKKFIGTKKMELDERTHEYIVAFISHKLAYENYIGKANPSRNLLEYTETGHKTLHEIAEIAEIDYDELKSYNQWLHHIHHRVPEDKTYTVILPAQPDLKDALVAKLDIKTTPLLAQNTAVIEKPRRFGLNLLGLHKRNNEPINPNDVPLIYRWNGLDVIDGKAGDNIRKLAIQGNVKYKKFLRYNDLRKFDEVKPGQLYYLEEKNDEGKLLYHIVKENETLWDISQMYGIKLKKLRRKNRLDEGEALVTGRKLYLKYDRPDDEGVIIIQPKVIQKDTVILKSVNTNTNTIEKNENQLEPAEIQTVVDLIKKANVTNHTEIIHEVSQGEGLYKIAKQYNVSIENILRWNNKTSPNLIKGEKLIIMQEKQ